MVSIMSTNTDEYTYKCLQMDYRYYIKIMAYLRALHDMFNVIPFINSAVK